MGGGSGPVRTTLEPECSNCLHDLLVQEIRMARRKEEVHGSENSFHRIVAFYLKPALHTIYHSHK